MEEFLAFLNDIEPLPDHLLLLISNLMIVHHYNKNDIIAKNEAVNNRFFFVVKGVVQYLNLYRGRQISKWFFMNNHVIALHQSFQTTRNDDQLIAYRPTTILSVHIHTLERHYSDYPELEHYWRIIAERQSLLWLDILDGIRLKNAEERLRFLKECFPELVSKIPIRHLADCIDMNPYTAIKVRAKSCRRSK